MSASDDQSGGRRLRDLDDDECRVLLAGHGRGRLAWDDAERGLTVIPVNYVVVGDDIIVRTSVHTELARHFTPGRTAFQIDEYDDDAHTGWSVLARGTARSAQYDDVPDDGNRPTAWVLGDRSFFIRIRIETLTGRRVVPA